VRESILMLVPTVREGYRVRSLAREGKHSDDGADREGRRPVSVRSPVRESILMLAPTVREGYRVRSLAREGKHTDVGADREGRLPCPFARP